MRTFAKDRALLIIERKDGSLLVIARYVSELSKEKLNSLYSKIKSALNPEDKVLLVHEEIGVAYVGEKEISKSELRSTISALLGSEIVQ